MKMKMKGGGDGNRTGGKEGIRARGEFGRQYPRSRTRPTGPGEGIVARGGWRWRGASEERAEGGRRLDASAEKGDNVVKGGIRGGHEWGSINIRTPRRDPVGQ